MIQMIFSFFWLFTRDKVLGWSFQNIRIPWPWRTNRPHNIVKHNQCPFVWLCIYFMDIKFPSNNPPILKNVFPFSVKKRKEKSLSLSIFLHNIISLWLMLVLCKLSSTTNEGAVEERGKEAWTSDGRMQILRQRRICFGRVEEEERGESEIRRKKIRLRRRQYRRRIKGRRR